MSKKIVWIDDDIDIISSVTVLLERAGHHFLHIRSVSEALENVDKIRNCDLLLLDIILPPGNTDKTYSRYSGVELLRELRERHQVKIPTIVFSVVASDDVHRELWKLGVDDILMKPILPSILKERVEKVWKAPSESSTP